jgi:thiol-disulfide isomerase/thioredoxin
MARAHAGEFDQALSQFKELMQGLDQNVNNQEEFASSFAESLCGSAIAAGQYGVARQVYTTLLARFKESPTLRQKVQDELKRLDQVGRLATSFAVEDIQGHPLRLEAFRGKYVLLDFWATWCAPNVAELPRLQAAYQTYHEAGLEIISISLDETKPAVVDFVKARKLSWPQVHNASSTTDLVEAFRVSSIPASYLIDPQGTIIRLDLRGKALDQALSQLLKRRAEGVSAR